MSVWDVALQLEAHRQGRAIARVGRRYLQIDPDAMLLCPLSMAGWDPSLQAVAVGRLGRRPQVVSCADPREWDLQLETFSRLRGIIEPWMHQLYADGEGEQFPQLVVQSSAAAKLLVGLAHRLAWLNVPDAGKDRKRWSEDARQLGRLLLYFQQQLDVPGQQSVVVASSALNQHFAIGQDSTDHLGALLTWINPPRTGNVALAALTAERETLGVRSSPEFDAELSDLVNDFLKVKNGDPSRRSFAQRNIEDLVEEELLDPIVEAVRQALDAIDQLNLEPLPALEKVRHRELRAFHAHMKYLAADGHFAKTDKPRAAVRGLTVLEDATEQWQKAALWGDPIALAKGRFDGDVLHGTVNVAADRPGQIIVRSQQRLLKVRRGDELRLMADPQVAALVESIFRDGSDTVVVMACEDATPEGELTDWTGSPPSWHMLGISLGKVFRRLAAQPETHRPDSSVDRPAIPPMSADPVAALKEFAA